MNAFDILKQDHRLVDEIFTKLKATPESQSQVREELFTKLATELTVHAQVEEDILYPTLQEFEETEDLIDESYEEHDQMKQYLSEMASLPAGSEQWTEKLNSLIESVHHHVAEEEGEVFQEAESVLSDGQIEEITNLILAEKQQLKEMTAGM
jgi:iron-sulfur cluster repair protein YtfE (RIC family)